MKREIDTRENIKVVTKNDFITARGLSKLDIKSRKLLYFAIAQCQKSDREFYEYEISVSDFAKMMGIKKTNVYQEADKITDSLMKTIIEIRDGKGWDKYSLFSRCSYKDGTIYFKLNSDMTSVLLSLSGNFSQPLLNDFIRMKSPYSMAIWHLIQEKMASKKAYGTKKIKFDLTIEEIREVTGTQDKLKQLGHLKERVLDKALREIKDNCGQIITYDEENPIRQGRAIIGYHFTAVSENYIPPERRTKKLNKKLAEIETLKGQLTTNDIGI